jgi:abequosyltransferase
MKKIAICIPTFNRGSDLRELLDKILMYGEKYIDAGLLEVCISDNASVDCTLQVIDVFKERIKTLSYSRNTENIGFGLNLRRAVEMSSGDYCWLMGSDDLPTAQSFNLLFDSANKLPDIIIGDVISNGTLHKLIAKNGGFIFEFGGESHFSDYLNLCKEVSAAFAFISSIVVKRDFWYQQNATPYEATHPYTHMIQLCKNIAFKQTRLLYVDFPIVEHGFENKNEFNKSALPHFELDLTTFDYITKFYFGKSSEVVSAYAKITKKNFNSIRIFKARIEATNEQWEKISLILLGYGYKESFLCKRRYDALLKYIFEFSNVLRSYRFYFWE